MEAAKGSAGDMGNCTKAQGEAKKFDHPSYELEHGVIRDLLMKKNENKQVQISKALIIGLQDHKAHANEPSDFQPPPKTIRYLLDALDGDTDGLAENFIDLGEGKIYIPGKMDPGVAIFGTHGDGSGCVIYKTRLSVIIVTYVAGQNPAVVNRLVMETAEFLAEEGR